MIKIGVDFGKCSEGPHVFRTLCAASFLLLCFPQVIIIKAQSIS